MLGFARKLNIKVFRTQNINHLQTFRRNLSSNEEKHEFKAETKRILDIVTNAIYTDKEVFLRELVSNASDALEKLRYHQTVGDITGDGSPLEIKILTDTTNGTITITDNGIGMNKDDLISNLGTIARSGSKAFVENLDNLNPGEDKSGIIGQFGVGFYSAFMVGDSVTVTSKRAKSIDGTEFSTHSWKSDGSGEYSISETTSSDIIQGSSIEIELKDEYLEFCDPERIKEIIKKYSNFVSFPVELNGDKVNTVSAIWLQDKNEVTKEQYEELYKDMGNAYDTPRYTLHFKTDAPLDMKALFFIPNLHTEKFGMARMDPGVDLYCRKVLIEEKPKDLLPEWLRFVKGVVDSEDLPLSLSREKPQDSGLLKRIKDVLTRKLIRFLDEQRRKDAEKWREFYIEFNFFLKEGICSDYQFADQIAKLLMFESSKGKEGELFSFDDYISRIAPEQKEIYYLVAPSRQAAMSSPYMETFKKHDKDVLLLYTSIDDFVMTNLKTFGGRNLTSAENGAINLANDEDDDDDKDDETDNSDNKDGSKPKNKNKLNTDESEALCGWLKYTLGEERVKEVKITHRLNTSPAIITDHESGSLRRMMQMVNAANNDNKNLMKLPPQILELNPKHPIIVGLSQARERGADETVLKLVAEQMMDNALVAAGLLDDPQSMLPRLNEIMAATLEKK